MSDYREFQYFSMAKNRRLSVDDLSNMVNFFPTFKDLVEKYELNYRQTSKRVKVVHNYCASSICPIMASADEAVTSTSIDPVRLYFDSNNKSVICDENLDIIKALMKESTEILTNLRQLHVSMEINILVYVHIYLLILSGCSQ